MYDYTLPRGRKDFCRYCLQAFRTADALNVILKAGLNLIANKGLICPKMVNLSLRKKRSYS